MTGFCIAIAVVLAAVIYGYNKAVVLKNYVSEGFATMDVYLKKRWDLLPNLIETVKSYTAHEKNLLTDLTKIRSQNYDTLSDGEKLNANMQIGRILPKIHAVAENYPDLKSNQTMITAMQTMNEVEEHISAARRFYNSNVTALKNAVEIFPSSVIAGMMNITYQDHPFFEISDVERKPINTKDFF